MHGLLSLASSAGVVVPTRLVLGTVLGTALVVPSLALLALLAVVAVVPWRKPLPSVEGTQVLVVEPQTPHRAQLQALLQGLGCTLRVAADSHDAVGILRGSPQPLVVVLDRRQLTVLELARADRRLAAHHAFVLLGTWTHTDLLLMLRLRRQLRLRVVHGRRHWRAIVRAVARAAGTLPRDPLYPVPAADQPPASA